MMEGQISVIIAIYNTRKYLNRCLDSVINQKYKNLDIILIDDGSTDGSESVCDAYARNDVRIRVIHKNNEGLSVARNNALSIASGEYVSFIDSDDVLAPNLFEQAVEAIKKNDVDFVKYEYCTEEADLYANQPVDMCTIFSGQEITDLILRDKFGSQLWQYLFKISLWDGIISPPGRLAQDMMVLHTATAKAARAAVMHKVLYFYYQQRNDNVSNTNKKHVRGTADRAYAYWLRTEFCRNNEKYRETFNACLVNAVSYTVSAFCNREFSDVTIYEHDRKLFRKNIKLYMLIILKEKELSFSRKICAILISLFPWTVYRLYPMIWGKGGNHES